MRGLNVFVWGRAPSTAPRIGASLRASGGNVMTNLYQSALADLAAVFDRIDDAAVDAAVGELAAANRIAFYACGREGLQIRGFCMRMFHLGRQVAMVGDMTTFPIGPG